MNLTIPKILRKTMYYSLLLLGILTIAASILLSQLELDNYRHKLERELSATLDQPVQIGYCKLAFNDGIALRFQDMRIGPPEAPLAEIPRLTATLRIVPLLERRIILDQVEIDNPSFQVWLPIINQPERDTAHQLTGKLGIRVLTVKDASIKVHQRQPTGSRELLNLELLDIELRGWKPKQSANLIISGQLQQSRDPAKFLINIDLPSSTDPEVWRNEPFDTKFTIDNLATDLLEAAWETGFPANVDLHATLQGIPNQGALVGLKLSDKTSEQPVSELTGRWTSSSSEEAITALNGDFFGLPLEGEFLLLRQAEQQVLAGRFGASNVPLDRGLLELWKIPGTDSLLNGKLNRLELIVDKHWNTAEQETGLPRVSAEVSISELEWEENDHRQLKNFSATLSLEDKTLSLEAGELAISQQSVLFSGRINSLFNEPQLDLKINLQGKLDTLFEQKKLPKGWALTGKFPINLALTGPLPTPNFRLSADLTEGNLDLEDLLQKPVAQKSSLLLEGIIDSEQVQLDRLELQLPGLSVTGNGCFSHDPKSDFFLLDIDPIDLSKLRPISPLLTKLKLQGNLHPTLERSPEGLKTSLQLINVGVHLNHIVGDLNRASGNINLDQSGLRFQDLKASFGKSDFVLSGHLDDWQKPQLDLKLQSKKVRAQDLIFANQKLRFYDLDGRLQIDAGGINFDQIKVRLEQETEVVVNGTLDDFSALQVTLDIEAEKANIDQVIQLFVGPRKTPPKAPNPKIKPLLINARVKQGTIGALRVQNVEGLIKDHHQVFTIYPLRFHSDEGFCLARIEFDHHRPGGLLKISGHAEGFDASVLHREIFKKRGLVSGTLRGDFYLEGSLTDNKFWHNATGGIHLQVENGTLRKFSGLASVFSLLNVSQLFVGKLPNIDKEGMPFTLVDGTIKISNGLAETEDLRVTSESMNMALIGGQSLTRDHVSYNLVVMPLRTVDKVITSIPVAGWVLAGENEALLTAHFTIEGSGDDPEVTSIPTSTVSNAIFGIVKRTFGLPGKLVKDIGEFFELEPKKKVEPND